MKVAAVVISHEQSPTPRGAQASCYPRSTSSSWSQTRRRAPRRFLRRRAARAKPPVDRLRGQRERRHRGDHRRRRHRRECRRRTAPRGRCQAHGVHGVPTDVRDRRAAARLPRRILAALAGAGFRRSRGTLVRRTPLRAVFSPRERQREHYGLDARPTEPRAGRLDAGSVPPAATDDDRSDRRLRRRFRLYCEDIDLCYRAAKAGWERWYVPERRRRAFLSGGDGLGVPDRRTSGTGRAWRTSPASIPSVFAPCRWFRSDRVSAAGQNLVPGTAVVGAGLAAAQARTATVPPGSVLTVIMTPCGRAGGDPAPTSFHRPVQRPHRKRRTLSVTVTRDRSSVSPGAPLFQSTHPEYRQGTEDRDADENEQEDHGKRKRVAAIPEPCAGSTGHGVVAGHRRVFRRRRRLGLRRRRGRLVVVALTGSGSSLGASSPESFSSALGASFPNSSVLGRRLSEERLLERAADVVGSARVGAQVLGKLGDRVLVALGRVRSVDDAVVGPIIDNVLGAGTRGRGTSGKDDQGDESDERAPGRARRSCNGLPVRPAHGVQFYRSGLSGCRGMRPAA